MLRLIICALGGTAAFAFGFWLATLLPDTQDRAVPTIEIVKIKPVKPSFPERGEPDGDLEQKPDKPTESGTGLSIIPKPITTLAAFTYSPFPYEGVMPNNKPFLNFEEEGRLAHKTGSGRVYWADETYSDSRSLIHIPKGFNLNKPGVIVLFFHGHGATLQRDVLARQRVPMQVSRSGVNAILIAPQFAFDARDSSAGNFWKKGAARDFLQEASQKFAEIVGAKNAKSKFNSMPVLLVGYSGGYMPVVSILARGGIDKRIKGVILLDALYGGVKTIGSWIQRNRSTVFLSAYTKYTKRRNVKLQEILTENNIPYSTELDIELQEGAVVLLESEEDHRDYVTKAWVVDPVADMLKKISNAVSIGTTHSASLQFPN